MTRFPQQTALRMLLEQGQFDACRMVAEKMIEESMTHPGMDGQHAGTAMSRWQEQDLELAYLHLTLSKCLFGLHEYENAAIAADMAGLLARKANDLSLHAEVMNFAGACYCQAANYRLAAERLTSCLGHATGLLRAEALYNRGHVYTRQLAFRYAVTDYEEALRLVHDVDPGIARLCRINLTWALIVLRDFHRAEEIMAQLSAEPEADADELLQLQLKHDRLHIACMKGEGKDALKQILQALRQAGSSYPHVKARIALSLLSVASGEQLPEKAFSAGILAKRLAGRADRPDIDEEAGRSLRVLEAEFGTDHLIQPLQRSGELTAGALSPSKTRRGHTSGGVR